jgi:hypothetical protein
MPNSANILLHGLFVLQYQGNKLIAMTPDTPHHQFLFRHQGRLGSDRPPLPDPFPILPKELDFTNLPGNTAMPPFPTTLPQFSKTTTGVGDLVGVSYRCRIVFNWPLDIMVLRSGGKLSDYNSVPRSVVGQDIRQHSGPELGLITLLHFETTGPSFTTNIFAEHRIPPPKQSHMNPVLAAAKTLFANGAKFDLQLADGTAPPICPDDVEPGHPFPAKAKAYGVQQNDELSFGEVYDNKDCARPVPEGTDVANCVQFGLLG